MDDNSDGYSLFCSHGRRPLGPSPSHSFQTLYYLGARFPNEYILFVDSQIRPVVKRGNGVFQIRFLADLNGLHTPGRQTYPHGLPSLVYLKLAALCNLVRLFDLKGKGQLAILPRYANSRGARNLGLLPEPSPAVKQQLTGLWGGWPEAEPLNTDRMMVDMKKEEINGCLVIGCNPVMLYPDREFAHDALEGGRSIGKGIHSQIL